VIKIASGDLDNIELITAASKNWYTFDDLNWNE